MKTMILENGSKKKCHLRTARKARVDCVQNPQVKDKVQNTECHQLPNSVLQKWVSMWFKPVVS